MKNLFTLLFILIAFTINDIYTRERQKMDFEWRFALGNSFDAKKDFDNGSGYFSYFAKAGYGDGAAARDFDDRAWRVLDLPHDWCVELPFDSLGGHSHGYKAIGRDFPQNSVGWYRKKFFIPESDLGKKISIEFDGVHRNSIVWVNGFYLGTEHSGYTSFNYDLTEYLNYGAENVIAVRVDATMEEGWYYEGAGIYRHVWLVKTSPLHVDKYGTFVTTDLSDDNSANITIRSNIINENNKKFSFDIEEKILNSENKVIASNIIRQLSLGPAGKKEYYTSFRIEKPRLWSLEDPYLHKLITTIRSDGIVLDEYQTIFGIRTVKFDADKGFFLNGKNVKLLGTNMHQDHAGVGTAIPDALQEYRVKKLLEMGSNAIRTAHNPPTPELLDICDKLGMLVLDENRLMGINEEHYSCLERLIKRDRNHPCVILWSLGNEEWKIEGNITGARITSAMQGFAQRLDSSRAFTVALSGGWDTGSGMTAGVMGYNYIVQGDIDVHHKKFPLQPGVGTEETTTKQTRGIYFSNSDLAYMAPTRRMPENVGTEFGWQFYKARPFLAGLFYWTGFDYRGEANPHVWPAVMNQAGMFDLCGFPKDYFYYLKSWWGKEPVLHIMPHWNWNGKEGEEIKVTVFSNCDNVELFLNDKSMGMKEIPEDSFSVWNLSFQPGILAAKGFKDGKEIISEKIETTGQAEAIQIIPDRTAIKSDGEDVSVITIQINDSKGLLVPDACNNINFKLDGPGRIIGVGNGNPSSHERERFFESIITDKIRDLKEFAVDNLENRSEVAAGFNDVSWEKAFTTQSDDWQAYTDSFIVVRGSFSLPEITEQAEVNLFTKSIVENQFIYVNGHPIAKNIKRDDPNQSYNLERTIINSGKNDYAVVGKRFRKIYQWDEPNTDPGLVQVILPSEQWERKAFNGLAQVIVKSTKQAGEITLTAESEGLKSNSVKIISEKAP